MYRTPSNSFDPRLAEVAVVSREGRQWVLRLHRFTGEEVATVPLHVDGEFLPAVHRLVGRVLGSWGLAAAPAAEWTHAGNHWSALVPAASLAGDRGVLI